MLHALDLIKRCEDLIDKQSNSIAQVVFSKGVEDDMVEKGWHKREMLLNNSKFVPGMP